MKILITDNVDSLFLELLKKNNIKYNHSINEDRNTILKKIHLFTGLVVRNRIQIDENFLDQAKSLKFIFIYLYSLMDGFRYFYLINRL